jgi:hypothetical protein
LFLFLRYLFRLIHRDCVDGESYLDEKKRKREEENRNNYAACCYINTHIQREKLHRCNYYAINKKKKKEKSFLVERSVSSYINKCRYICLAVRPDSLAKSIVKNGRLKGKGLTSLCCCCHLVRDSSSSFLFFLFLVISVRRLMYVCEWWAKRRNIQSPVAAVCSFVLRFVRVVGIVNDCCYRQRNYSRKKNT